MATVDFTALTAPNGAIEKLSEVLFTTSWKIGELANSANVKVGQRNKKKIGYLDSIDPVAVAGRGCEPTYTAVMPRGYEKAWDMGDYQIPLKICAQVWRDTIAEYALNTGTEQDNLDNTEIMDKVLIPLLNKAYDEALWRMAWFGDEDAALVANSGVITAGTDLTLLNMTDGLWKRIFDLISSNAAQRTTIAANAQTTYATQKSALNTSGVAVGIIEALLSDADGRIFNNGGVLMMTNSFYQALRKDYNRTYNATIPFENVSRGVSISEFDGIPIRVFNEWDINIKTYEDNGSALNAPHRVVYANPNNLLIGTEDKAMLADLDIFFDKTTRLNHFYAASNIGTLIAEDDLVQVAY